MNPIGQRTHATRTGAATNGTVTLVGTTVTFTPATNFAGTASFRGGTAAYSANIRAFIVATSGNGRPQKPMIRSWL